MTILEVYTRHGFICTRTRLFERRSKRRDREHAAAGGLHLAALAFSSGMENLHILELGSLVET